MDAEAFVRAVEIKSGKLDPPLVFEHAIGVGYLASTGFGDVCTANDEPREKSSFSVTHPQEAGIARDYRPDSDTLRFKAGRLTVELCSNSRNNYTKLNGRKTHVHALDNPNAPCSSCSS